METEDDERKLAEQGNTDAKLYVPDEAEQEDEHHEDAPDETSGETGDTDAEDAA
jgi:hypothetical protein